VLTGPSSDRWAGPTRGPAALLVAIGGIVSLAADHGDARVRHKRPICALMPSVAGDRIGSLFLPSPTKMAPTGLSRAPLQLRS
jgi:hypothetical protein